MPSVKHEKKKTRLRKKKLRKSMPDIRSKGIKSFTNGFYQNMYLPMPSDRTTPAETSTTQSKRVLPHVNVQEHEYSQQGLLNVEIDAAGASVPNLPKIRIKKPKKHDISEIVPHIRNAHVKRAISHL